MARGEVVSGQSQRVAAGREWWKEIEMCGSVVRRDGGGGGGGTTQNSQLTCLLCAWWAMKPAGTPPAECLANLMFTLTPNFWKFDCHFAVRPTVRVCLHVSSSQWGFPLLFLLPPAVPSTLIVFIIVSLVCVMWTDVRQQLRLAILQRGKGQRLGPFTHWDTNFFWP